MNIKIKHYWPNIIDFLIANLIILLVFIYRDSILEFWKSPYPPPFIDVPKSYRAFIEGLMAGVLIGVYIFFKKKINVLSVILGMWLYPCVKYTEHRPLYYNEQWLIYLSNLSMFIGIFCIFFHLASIVQKARKT
jgi:hypothetical protein